jgi:muramoyltetrapeptide carboxypeptidase LdcA involved in peptidoglycan recycling
MVDFELLSLQVLVPRQFACVCHSVNMEWGVKEKHGAMITLHNCGKSNFQIFKLLKPLKILQILRKCRGLKAGLHQDARKV